MLEYTFILAALTVLFVAPVSGGVSPAAALALALHDYWATWAWLIASL